MKMDAGSPSFALLFVSLDDAIIANDNQLSCAHISCSAKLTRGNILNRLHNHHGRDWRHKAPAAGSGGRIRGGFVSRYEDLIVRVFSAGWRFLEDSHFLLGNEMI